MSIKESTRPFPDPMAEREAGKYEHPVASREAVLALLAARGEPLSFKELTRALGMTRDRDLDAFGRRLRAMERDGQVLKNRRGRYGLVAKMDMVCGRVSGHPDGFGFLVPDQGGEDLFLSPRDMRQVLHGDRVMAAVTRVDARGRRHGRIVEVLERQHHTVVGRFSAERRLSYVVPEDKRISQDILVPPDERGAARQGQIVVAEILQQPTRSAQPVGRVIEVLGDHMAPGMETEIAIRKYELPYIWPDDVLGETDMLPAKVPARDKQGRVDLRKLPLVTIDGEDARDFDDAVYCERDDRGWRLVVAIADVSHYVRPGTALDREAYQRGNSVYFPDRVIPMLPEALSNGLCSINPDVDRLCMVCDMVIGPRGKIRSYRFYQAVMRSHARLTYTEVAAMLVDGDQGLLHRYRDLAAHLQDLYKLFKILLGARKARGAVDLDLPETRILYDAQHRIERIVPVIRNDAHRLIEECMLAANVCAAELLAEHKVPSLYRIHKGPSPEKLEDLRGFLFELGLSLGGGDKPDTRDYAELIASLEGRPDITLIQTVLLRSLSQAIYSPDNVGHFALGYVNYTHFTSPIRRYPDLLVHRAIKGIVAGMPVPRDDRDQTRVDQQGEHCSMTERRADEATRDVINWLKAEYMLDKVGEVFDGIISGVTNFGIFVELKEIFVEGLVHVTELGNDYYHFDPAHHRLTGERTKQTFRLGGEVRVRVARVDVDEARIDFALEDHKGKKMARRGAGKVKTKKKKKTAIRRKARASR